MRCSKLRVYDMITGLISRITSALISYESYRRDTSAQIALVLMEALTFADHTCGLFESMIKKPSPKRMVL